MSKAFTCCALLMFLFSCSRQLDQRDYIQWVQDYSNGLHVKKEYAEFLFDLQFQPPVYFALLNNSLEKSHPKKEGTDEVQFYSLKISLKDNSQDILNYKVSSTSEKQQRLYYYSYLFQNDIFLEENGEERPCILFHYEQSGITKTKTFHLGFQNSLAEEAKLIIKSEQFGSVPIKIKISKRNIPALKI